MEVVLVAATVLVPGPLADAGSRHQEEVVVADDVEETER